MYDPPSLDDQLDLVEEARADLKQYRDLCFNLGLLTAAAAAMVLIGAVFASFAFGIVAIIVGGVAAPVAAICLIVRVSIAYESGYDKSSGYRHPAKRLREAELKYRRMLRDQA